MRRRAARNGLRRLVRLLPALAATLLSAILPGAPAGAQGFDGPDPGSRDIGGFARRGTPGEFDFYVLALSWSPTFCEGAGRGRDADQCAPGRGLGFVVHGLWPQYARGFPESCSAVERAPTRQAMEIAGQVFPSEGLARYEWRKHGTCSGLDPVRYFSAVREARLAVAIPDDLKGSSEDRRLAPVEIARRFVLANRGLRPDMLAVTCGRGRLQEVRVCLAKDLRGFTPCPEVARANCRAPEIAVDGAR